MRKVRKAKMHLQGETATATKAIYQGHHIIPTILMTYKVRGTDPDTGSHFDHIEIELDVYTASKLANQLLVSIDAALPGRPRGAIRVPFE